MLTRHGYFLYTAADLLAAHSAAAASHAPPTAGGSGVSGGLFDEEEAAAVSHSRSVATSAVLSAAITSLEEATAADSGVALAWRNLSLAYKAADRLADSERAMGRAVDADGGMTADLLYRHAAALKRIGQWERALCRYCDVLDVEPTNAPAAYWMRITLAAMASPPSASPPSGTDKPAPSPVTASTATLERVQVALKRFADAARSSEGGVSTGDAALVPHLYIKRLFDGYAAKFDHHLTVCLGYRTPTVMLQSVLGAAGVASDPSSQSGRQWRRCADLGCGTGLAGVAFRPYVHTGGLEGVDLSSGMVAEARKRDGVYDRLDVGDVEAWLADRTAAGAWFDLIVAADVFVYIGDLSRIVHQAAEALRRASLSASTSAPSASDTAATTEAVETAAATSARSASSSLRPLFAFSTEAASPGDSHTAVATTAGTPAVPSSGAVHGDGDGAADEEGYRLSGTGRCVHHRWYILRLAARCGLVPVKVERTVIRQNAGVDVVGDLYVLGLP